MFFLQNIKTLITLILYSTLILFSTRIDNKQYSIVNKMLDEVHPWSAHGLNSYLQ